MKNILLLLFFSITALSQSTIPDAANGLLIPTQQGPVTGSLSASTVRQFLGVPYAIAKRWQAPQLPPLRHNVLQATEFGDSCVQNLNPGAVEFLVLAGGLGLNTSESENCLTVNIWAPSVQRKQNAAVLLWIYGGSTQFGTSNIPIYVGSNFVRDNDDIVIVSFNYRMNIFGQPNAPQLVNGASSQNFGLLDLDAAVTWVHDNIAGFGGDPERISIFGQSAGATSADQYAYAHPNDTKVKGIILQSGTAFSVGTTSNPTPPALDPTPWNTISQVVGCGTDVTPAQFACMQTVPFGKLENAVINATVTFNRVVDNINVFSDYPARAAAGNFLKVPMLGGTTANEIDIFLLAQEILAGIPNPNPTIFEIISDVTTLGLFTCSASIAAQARNGNNVPTWRYQYQAVFPDISAKPLLRAYHASEIPLVFGTYNTSTAAAHSSTEIALSKFVQGAWVAFARNPQQGLVNIGWPKYSSGSSTLAQLGNEQNQTGIVFTQGQVVDSACVALNMLTALVNQLTSLL